MTTVGTQASAAPDPLLEIEDVVVEYARRGWHQKALRALRGVSLTVGSGETVGLVGESGSGKTTLGRAVLGLVPIVDGVIRYKGQVISGLTRRERRGLSEEIQVVFQDPYGSLNPAMTIEEILSEPLLITGVRKREAGRRVLELLDLVHLPSDAAGRFAREFSGGQRQRIAIAWALCRNPKLIVCDEPVSALDLTTQAHILKLLIELQERTGAAYLFITHDLAVVRYISHRVAVMYRGEIVEAGDTGQVTGQPQDMYTRRLLLAAPVPDPERQRERRAQWRQLLDAGPAVGAESSHGSASTLGL